MTAFADQIDGLWPVRTGLEDLAGRRHRRADRAPGRSPRSGPFRPGEADGRIVVSAPATPALFAAVESGKRSRPSSFYALEERTTRTSLREVLRALVTGATVTDRPEHDTTRAKVRERTEAPLWL